MWPDFLGWCEKSRTVPPSLPPLPKPALFGYHFAGVSGSKLDYVVSTSGENKRPKLLAHHVDPPSSFAPEAGIWRGVERMIKKELQ